MGNTPTLDVSRAPKYVVSLLAGIALSIMMVRTGIDRQQARAAAEQQPPQR